MKKQLIYLKILQIAIDALLILLAFALAYFLRIGFFFSNDFPFDKYAIIAGIATPITILFMFFARTYKMSQQVFSLRHIQRILFVAIENIAVFSVLYYFAYRTFFSRLILVYIFALSSILIFSWHVLFRWILKKASHHEIGVYRTLIIGANRPAHDIIETLIKSKSHIKPVAIIDAHGRHKMIHGIPVVGKMNRFERAIAEHDIDYILQTDHLEQTLNIINYALQNNVKYIMPPELLGIFQGFQSLDEIEGQPFLKVHKKKKWWNNIW